MNNNSYDIRSLEKLLLVHGISEPRDEEFKKRVFDQKLKIYIRVCKRIKRFSLFAALAGVLYLFFKNKFPALFVWKVLMVTAVSGGVMLTGYVNLKNHIHREKEQAIKAVENASLSSENKGNISKSQGTSALPVSRFIGIRCFRSTGVDPQDLRKLTLSGKSALEDLYPDFSFPVLDEKNITGVKYTVIGSIEKIGPGFIMELRIVEVPSTEIVCSRREEFTSLKASEKGVREMIINMVEDTKKLHK